ALDRARPGRARVAAAFALDRADPVWHRPGTKRARQLGRDLGRLRSLALARESGQLDGARELARRHPEPRRARRLQPDRAHLALHQPSLARVVRGHRGHRYHRCTGPLRRRRVAHSQAHAPARASRPTEIVTWTGRRSAAAPLLSAGYRVYIARMPSFVVALLALLAVSCTQEQQNRLRRDVQNWTGTNGVLEIFSGDKVVRRFLKIDKLSTAYGTD